MNTPTKQSLCEAFCNELELTQVPTGTAVRTGFLLSDGDAIGFYVTRNPFDQAKFRIEDSGLAVPMLEASGINLETGTRAIAFKRMLSEYGVFYDDDTMELHSAYVDESEVADQAMRFVALMLRLQDFELLHPTNVESTFREDATEALQRRFGTAGRIKFDVPPAASLAEMFQADALIESGNDSPVAVYLGTSDSRVDEAVMLWMDNQQSHRNMRVAVMLEREKPSLSGRTLRRALNRVDATVAFRGDEDGAIARIDRLAGAA
jgi:hypothetical protein